VLEKLKRKYGGTLRAAIEKRDQLERELNALEVGGQNLEALEEAISQKEKTLSKASRQLSEMRQTVAENLKAQLMVQLQVLAMPGVLFDVAFLPLDGYSREGVEVVEFQFSANPGEPLKPLAKVASGGELSRFLLAMKTLTAQADGLLTLVFDEIDTGISGPTAKAVAEKLAGLSRQTQVLAITHQPMIAVMGRQHLHVEKQIVVGAGGDETVFVDVQHLTQDEDRRLKILSRLVSGTDTGDEAVEAFIRRLRAQAQTFYESIEMPVMEVPTAS
jgi:DNA repair protein RecN (Recombination protein N)